MSVRQHAYILHNPVKVKNSSPCQGQPVDCQLANYQPTVGRWLAQAVGQLSVNSQATFGGLSAFSFFHYSGNHLSKMIQVLESQNKYWQSLWE